MVARRARTGRGWDASPPRRRTPSPEDGAADHAGRHRGRRAGGQTPPAAPVPPAELAREICLRQLAVRPRTRAELAVALRRHDIDEAVVAEVLDRYAEVGMIDDEAFARAWVTSRHHGRGLARRALAGELRQKGIDSETIGAAVDEVDGDTEARTARELVQRKLRTAGRDTPEALFRRLVNMLARKGYPAGLAIRVVKEALAERDATGSLRDIDADALAEHLAQPSD